MRKVNPLYVFAVLLALIAAPVTAQSLKDDPGFVDFEPLVAQLDKAPEVSLNFGPALLQVFAATVRESDSGLAELLSGLRGLRVMVFEGVDTTPARSFQVATREQLDRTGWESALSVRDASTHVDMYLKAGAEAIEGLALMVTEDDGTAVFINVVGALNPAALGKLVSGTGFDLGALAELATQLNGGD